jgi:hypothetical protein
MVTLPGDDASNMTPPSLALLTCSLWLMGLVLLLRASATRIVQRPRAWVAVVVANSMIMTAFLWHLSAIIAVNGVLVVLDAPVFPPVGSGEWWLLRLPLLVAVGLVLSALVLTFRSFEKPRPWSLPDLALRRPHRDLGTVAGGLLILVGILGLSVAGFAGVLSLRTAQLVVVPMASLPSVLLVLAGVWLTTRSASPIRGRTRERA